MRHGGAALDWAESTAERTKTAVRCRAVRCGTVRRGAALALPRARPRADNPVLNGRRDCRPTPPLTTNPNATNPADLRPKSPCSKRCGQEDKHDVGFVRKHFTVLNGRPRLGYSGGDGIVARRSTSWSSGDRHPPRLTAASGLIDSTQKERTML